MSTAPDPSGRIRWAVVALVASIFAAVPAAAPAAERVEVIVQMDAGRSAATGKSAVRAAGGKVTGELPIVNGFAAELSAGAVDRLEDAEGVKAVTVDNAVEPQGISLSRLQTAYPASVDAPQLWNNALADVTADGGLAADFARSSWSRSSWSSVDSSGADVTRSSWSRSSWSTSWDK